MSIQEKSFLRWFAGIAATLLVTVVVWTFSILSTFDVQAERIKHNHEACVDIKDTHQQDMVELREDLKEIKSDIKELLRK